MIVRFVKIGNAIVLAIGDGGNDIERFNKQYWTGILGKEGNSAAAASDFSFNNSNI